MKKVIFVFSALIALSTSCNKPQDLFEETTTPNAVHQTMVPGGGGGTPINSTWTDKGCKGDVKDCVLLPVVVIKPGQIAAISNAIANGPIEVGNLFSSTGFADLVSNIDATLVAMLQSGEYTLVETTNSTSFVTYIVGNTLPVCTTNFNFALQFAK